LQGEQGRFTTPVGIGPPLVAKWTGCVAEILHLNPSRMNLDDVIEKAHDLYLENVKEV